MEKRLVDNLVSLSVLQAFNYMLPLLTVPYLVRVLGAERFGLVSFAQAAVQYFVILTDYGFHLSATRKISIHRSDAGELSEIFSAVLAAKACFLVIAFVVMSAAVFSFARFRGYWALYYLAFGTVAGSVLFPIWFFQGIEKMKYITWMNIIARLVFTALIFCFVRNSGDYLMVVSFNSLGSVLAGLAGLYAALRLGVRLKVPAYSSVRRELKDGFHIFLSFIGERLYTSGNVFILGLLANSACVGYYSAGERLIKAVQGLFMPVSQAIYPHMNSVAARSASGAVRFIKKVAVFSGALYLALAVVMFAFAERIVTILFGPGFTEAAAVVRIMAFLPFAAVMGNIAGTQVMLNFGMQRDFARTIVGAGLMHVFVCVVLTLSYGIAGMAFSALLTETVIAAVMVVTIKARGLRVPAVSC